MNMAAMCRCFPGKMKKPKSGDRKPNHQELNTCRPYLDFEIEYHKPKLIIAIGKMALEELLRLKSSKLRDYMGKIKKYEYSNNRTSDLIMLSHPSGFNAWNHSGEGKRLIKKSLFLIKNHEAFKKTFKL